MFCRLLLEWMSLSYEYQSVIIRSVSAISPPNMYRYGIGNEKVTLVHFYTVIANYSGSSRHTIVCRMAQEAGM